MAAPSRSTSSNVHQTTVQLGQTLAVQWVRRTPPSQTPACTTVIHKAHTVITNTEYRL